MNVKKNGHFVTECNNKINTEVNEKLIRSFEKSGDTLNYPKDSHKDFCKRCFAKHSNCPNTNTSAIDNNCSL